MIQSVIDLIETVYFFLWGDWIRIPAPWGGNIELPLLVLLLVPTGIYFTIRTGFLQIRLLPDMISILLGRDKEGHGAKNGTDRPF